MEEREGIQDLSLLGGPLHRLGCRMGLVRDGTNTVALGIVLGACPWIVLLALTLFEGLGGMIVSLEAIGAHVRLLVTIPLLFVCEAFIDPRFAMSVREIVRSGVVPASEHPALGREIARVLRWKEAWLPEALFLLAAALLAWSTPHEEVFQVLSGVTARSGPSVVGESTWASHWYWGICTTLFRFLFLRWLWRLALWSFFLWRVSRLGLRLVPTHPDRAGGLGYLELVHAEFTPLVLALSAAQSASLARDISSGRMTFQAMYPAVATILLADAVLFLGPLCVFSRKLWACKVRGLSDYGALAERYVNEFDRKWLGPHAAPRDPLLGTADIQSLADLSNSVGVVRNMRLVPVSPSLLLYLGGAALLPLLPLALLRVSLADALARVFGRLSSL